MSKFVKSSVQGYPEWHFIQKEKPDEASVVYITACKEEIDTIFPHQKATDGSVVQEDEAPVCPKCGF